jgi:hypothetical protein
LSGCLCSFFHCVVTVCLVVFVLLSNVLSLLVWLSLISCPLCCHCLSGCLCSFVHCVVTVCLVVFLFLSMVLSLCVWLSLFFVYCVVTACLVVFVRLSIVLSRFFWLSLFFCPLCFMSYFSLRLLIAYPFDTFKLYHNSISNGFNLISICASYCCHMRI